jgi:hypothetical protein
MLLKENLIFRLAFPSGVAKKYVDAEDHSKPTHQRGPWMPKEVANNLQRNVIGRTDLETDKADMELDLG